MSTARKKLFGILGVLIIVGIILGLGATHKSKQHGTVTLTYNVADTQDIAAHFNNQTLSPTADSSMTYTLPKDNYTLTVTKPGYKQFTTQFSLLTGQVLVINVSLQLASDPTITNPNQFVLPNISSSAVTIVKTEYFYDKTWAFLTIQVYGEQAYVALQYIPASQTWKTTLGPGTSFTTDDLQNLPNQVKSYMTDNNLVDNGSLEP